jgi:hypothetical protein
MVYYETPEGFKAYCRSQIQSISTAIHKKANGSTVENEYFLEHIEKLKNYFLNNEVKPA